MTLPSFLQRLQPKNRHSRAYLFGGRLRLSTAGLILAFCALYWVNQTYQPAPPAPATDPAQQVVPPGFVPDPNYTWVPRTNVETRAPESTTTTTSPTPTTTTTTTTTTPSPTPGPTATTSPETTTEGPAGPLFPSEPTTTVIDPDGPGPLGPQTFTQAPPVLPPSTVAPPVPAPTPPQP